MGAREQANHTCTGLSEHQNLGRMGGGMGDVPYI